MLRPRGSADLDPARQEHRPQRPCRIIGGIFDGQGGVQALLAEGSPAKKPHGHCARRALDARLARVARRCGDERIVQRVVSRRREPGSHSGLPHLRRRHSIQVDLVVVHAEGGSRCAISPLQVIPAPARAVAFEDKPGVVSDDISAYGMDAVANNLIGHILQRRQRRAGAFGLDPKGHSAG